MLESTLEGDDEMPSIWTLSPCGRWLASRSYLGNNLRLWDLHNPKNRRTIAALGGFLSDLSFSPDGLRMTVTQSRNEYFEDVILG